MPKQPAIPGLRDAMKKKVTRREMFLSEMDAVVPWTRLLALEQCDRYAAQPGLHAPHTTHNDTLPASGPRNASTPAHSRLRVSCGRIGPLLAVG